ncbi:MAG: hypothetical protein P8Z42_15330 [Anaerolineales bacterium]
MLSQICCSEAAPTTAAAPLLAPLPTRTAGSEIPRKDLAVETFDGGVEGWPATREIDSAG